MSIPNLTDIIKKYGSDKSLSGYDMYYRDVFANFVGKNINYLEIGLGTLIPDIPSTFIGNPAHYPHYEPAAVLKVWREYFGDANIYGIDIGKDCMLTGEDRIFTSLVDSTCEISSSEFLESLSFEFDIILDDGLHTAEGQLKTFNNFFKRVKTNGLYVIEDIGGGGDGRNLIVDNYDDLKEDLEQHEYFFGGNVLILLKNNSYKGRVDIQDLKKSINEIHPKNDIMTNPLLNEDMTIVTGLWNIDRAGRDFNHYIESFKKFLDIPQNLFIYIPADLEHLIWEKRSAENTFVQTYELSDIKTLYSPFWEKTQDIRNSSSWFNQAGWLPGSPQASNEWYNPIVQSKMFLLNDASIWNPFNTDYLFWLDAGITNTVSYDHLVHDNVLIKLTDHGNPFLFLSYPYEANTEIHGFDFAAINRYAGKTVEYVCRGGLFGGHKTQINEASSTYYSILNSTLQDGYMGTEESIFSIMANKEPELYRRYELDGNGLIVKFTESLKNGNVELAEIPKLSTINNRKYTDRDVERLKTNLYMLTFNFTDQVLHTIKSMQKTPILLERPNLFLLDNSTDDTAKQSNRVLCEQYGFEYIDLGGNTGICGGRQAAANHFNDSDADFMLFFEDDMTVNPPEFEGQFCRNGFRKYIPNLYNIIHKIMLQDGFDFLKLSFTEVYFDNDKQCSWYNVPQDVRTADWPHYDQLPVSGLDPNVPLTDFKNIRNMDGVTYIDGDVYYANWPMIVSKEGNKKMFIDTTWAHPYEQTWMSHMYQMTKRGDLNPGILLASPIFHDRIHHYGSGERREN